MNDVRGLAPEPKPFRRLDLPLVLVAVLIGFAARLYIAYEAFATSFDSSTVGIMAMRILEGDRPLFFYGQLYMGTLEAYTAALMFAIFGISPTALALAPICYAMGWIVGMYLLFREVYDGRHWVAFAAALTAAVSSVEGMWYTLATYGGYPEYLMFGTFFLWLSVRYAFRSLSSRHRWRHALAMGICAALCVWTNLQSAVFLVTGGIVLLAAAAVHRFKPAFLAPVIFTAAIGTIGFVPQWLERARIAFKSAANGGLRFDNIPADWENFLRLLPIHLWTPDAGPSTRAIILASLLIATIFYLGSIAVSESWAVRLKRLIPVLLALVFLSLYLPHPMARANAPRYLLAIFSVMYAAVLSAGFSLPYRVLRAAAVAPLVAMMVFQARASVKLVERDAPVKDTRVRDMRSTADTLQQLGIKHAYIVGNEIDGHMGQVYTFFAENRIKYVSLFSNRELEDEIEAEIDPRVSYLVQRWHTTRIREALQVAGISEYQVKPLDRDLFYDVIPPHRLLNSIPPKHISGDLAGQIEGNAENLFDRNGDTGLCLQWNSDTQSVAVVTIDLGESHTLGGIDLEDFSSAGLLREIGVEVSDNGKEYTTALAPKGILAAYSAGNKVYMLGYTCRWQLRFPPTSARFLRVRLGMLENNVKDWLIREMHVLTDYGPVEAVAQDEVQAIRKKLDDLRLNTVAADRWMTYQLGFRTGGFSLEGMIPTLNYRFRRSRVTRRIPCSRDAGFVVAREYGNEAFDVLQRSRPPGLDLERIDYTRYTLLYFSGTPDNPVHVPTVVWSGLMPLSGEDDWWEPKP